MAGQGVFRRTQWAGWSMAAGGVLLALPALLGASDNGNPRDVLLRHAAHPAVPIAKSLAFQAAALLILPGVAAIVGRVRGRGSAAVVSGGVIYGAGLVGLFSFVVTGVLGIELVQAGHLDAAVATYDRSSPATIPTFVLAILCFHLIGLPWLTLGMLRARLIPLWLAAVAIVGTGCAFFGSGTPIENVGWVVTGAAVATVGVTVVRSAAQPRAAVAELGVRATVE